MDPFNPQPDLQHPIVTTLHLNVKRLKELQGQDAFEAIFNDFYEAFSKAFPEEECIDAEDLKTSLREMEHFDLWTIYEGDSNHVIAGAITNMVESGGQKFGWTPYLFTEGDSRRQGIGKKMDELICSEAASQGAIGMFLEIVDPKRISVEEKEREIRFYNQGLDETLFSPEGRLAFWKACEYQEVGMHFISVGYDTPYMLMFKYLSPEQIGSKTISAKTVNEAILCNLGWMENPEGDPQFQQMMSQNLGVDEYNLS